jgi:hypothetical protein
VVITGLLVNLLAVRYPGGNNPASIAPLAFPIALLFVVIAGIPALRICALPWLACTASTRAPASCGSFGAV